MDVAAIERIYWASDGEATRELYRDLQQLGGTGPIAVNLLRAAKCSERAKLYRRGRGYKTAAYDRKDWSIRNLAELLEKDSHGLQWGWAIDEDLQARGDPHHHIVYIELPTGQVSFHVGTRHAGPDFAGEWDRQKNTAAERIIAWAASVFAAELA